MIKVNKVVPTERFQKDAENVSLDIKKAASDAIKLLIKNPQANSLRLHRLSGYKPPLWKIDVFTNKSWQIVFELHGDIATLKRLVTHKEANRL